MPPGRKGARSKRTEATPVPPPAPAAPPRQEVEEDEFHDFETEEPIPPPARVVRNTRAASRERQLRAAASSSAGATIRRMAEVVEVAEEEEQRQEIYEGDDGKQGDLQLVHHEEGDTTGQVDDSGPLLEVPPSPSGSSESGRSYRESTSGTQLEVSSINHTLAIEALPDLYRKSQSAFQFLFSSKTPLLLQRIRKPGSSAGSRLDHHWREFNVTKQCFGTTEFIDPKVVALVHKTDLFLPLVTEANYTALALGLVRMTGLTSETHMWLMNLEMTFPGAFLMGLERKITQEEKDRIATLVMELRTQLFIAMAHEVAETYSGDELLRQAFLEPHHEGGIIAEGELDEAWMMGARPKGWEGLSRKERRKVTSRILDLRGTYVRNNGGVDHVEELDFDYLASKWPWEGFVVQMMKFIKHMVGRLEKEHDMKLMLRLAVEARMNGLRESQNDDDDEVASSSAEDKAVEAQEGEEDGKWGFLEDVATLDAVETAAVQQAVQAHARAHKEGGRRSTRSSGQRLSSSRQLNFLKRRKSELAMENTGQTAPPGPSKVDPRGVATGPQRKKSDKIAATSAGIKALKTIANVKGKTRANNQAPVPVQPVQQQNDDNTGNVSGEDQEPPPASAAERNMAHYKRMKATGDKENQAAPQASRAAPPPSQNPAKKKKGFNERQENAQRLTFDSDIELQETQVAPGQQTKAVKSAYVGMRGAKRRRPETDDTREEEDEYVQIDSPEDTQRRKKSKMNPPPPAPPIPPRMSGGRDFIQPPPLPEPPAITRSRRQSSVEPRPRVSAARNRLTDSRRVSAPAESPRVSRPPRDDHESILNELHGPAVSQRENTTPERVKHSIKTSAELNRRLSIPKRNTAGQRMAWTPEEEWILIRQIALHGCRWSRIEKEGLLQRNQVQLKDKARNLKFLYLKSRSVLPPGFRQVTISAKMIAELQQMGIDHTDPRYYTLDESDVSEDDDEGSVYAPGRPAMGAIHEVEDE